jgi:hypothetical protein
MGSGFGTEKLYLGTAGEDVVELNAEESGEFRGAVDEVKTFEQLQGEAGAL